MRAILLASALVLAPTMAFCASTCTIPQSVVNPGAVTAGASDIQPDAAALNAEGSVPLGPDRIARVPALRRIASNGAQLFDLGVQHGLQTVFAKNGSSFQVFYLTPDGQAEIGGVMWDFAGRNITRGQVALIEGTVPTVTIGSPPAPASSMQTAAKPEAAAAESVLKIAEGTVFGTVGPSSAPRLYMFIDPLCSFSVRAMDQLRPYVAAGKLQVSVIPLSVLDYEDQGRSTVAAKALLSLPADKMAAAWRDQQTTPLPSEGPDASAHLSQNMAAAGALKLRGTPTIVWHKGDGGAGQATGLPDNIDALLASMAN